MTSGVGHAQPVCICAIGAIRDRAAEPLNMRRRRRYPTGAVGPGSTGVPTGRTSPPPITWHTSTGRW